MSLPFLITAIVTLFAAAAAMSLRNLVHCVLSFVVVFAGLAAMYLQLDAQFVGFAQILVYVGAIAILIVFAILLTRSGETPNQAVLAPGWAAGIAVSATVFTMLGWSVLTSKALPKENVETPAATVKNIGDVLMNKYVLPLEVIGLLLTAAMIGAVIIALKENSIPGRSRGDEAQTKKLEKLEPSHVGSYRTEKGGAA
jgi:NADH-quinone oxidoreductase subunit J